MTLPELRRAYPAITFTVSSGKPFSLVKRLMRRAVLSKRTDGFTAQEASMAGRAM